MNAKSRDAALKALFPDLPGWSTRQAIPLLVSLANAHPPEGRIKAIDTLMLNCVFAVAYSRLSQHQRAQVYRVIPATRYTEAEIDRATKACIENNIRIHSAALRVAFVNGQPGPEVLRLLEKLAALTPDGP